MTNTEMVQKFWDYMAESGTYTWGTSGDLTVPKRWLSEALEMGTNDFETYTLEKVIPVTAGVAEYDFTDIKPTLTGDEAVKDIITAQFSQGTSGLISSLSNDGATTTVTTAAAHGLAAGDVVQQYNTTDVDKRVTVVAAPTTTTYTYADTAGTNSTGVWVKESGYKRFVLNRQSWAAVQQHFFQAINQTSSEVPQGTLWLNWAITTDGLPSADDTDLSDTVFPTGLQKYLPAKAVALALAADGDDRLPSHIQTILSRYEARLEAFRRSQTEHEEAVMFGSYKQWTGEYAFRRVSERALIIRPQTIW
jgi:hypothetical protein